MTSITHPNSGNAIAVFSSHVVRGKVGNRAAAFALETLGFDVWAVPTIIMPWHPGHGPSHRFTMPSADFVSTVDALADGPFAGDISAVLSGYLGSPEQAGIIAGFVDRLRARNGNCLYVCDPVIGDDGGLYVPEATAEAMRDILLPRANVATPNLFELSWLTGGDAAFTPAEVMAQAQSIAPETVLVTSAPAMMRGHMANLLVQDSQAFAAEHRVLGSVPNGTGDLTAALLTAHRLRGAPLAKQLAMTSSAVFALLTRTQRRQRDELTLAEDYHLLSRPGIDVPVRQMMLSEKSA
ncbi:MAG: pyridoxal kinase [Pseudomonadota bacterium]